MKSIILSYNKALLSYYHQSQTQTSDKECNYRINFRWTENASHKMYFTKPQLQKTLSDSYAGFATNFEEHYKNYTAYFRHQSKRDETELSKEIWTLKDNNKPFIIKWKIIKQCRPHKTSNRVLQKCCQIARG